MKPQYILPNGKYTMLNASIRLTYGGATRSQLLRARLFSEHTSQPVELATFDAYPEYKIEQQLLTSKGLLTPGVKLRNLYEELSVAEDLRPFLTGPTLNVPAWFDELRSLEFTFELTKDGTPWRKVFDVNGDRKSFYFQYLRKDGSVYATVDRRAGGSDWDRTNRGVVLSNEQETPIGIYRSVPELISRWIKTLGAGCDHHFLIFDSKESGRLLVEQPREDNQYFILTAHTPHLQPPRQWNSLPATSDWKETVAGLALWDAFILLSDAHRADLELAEGKRNNLFVLPHPVTASTGPSSGPRQPNLVLIVCRLEKQKRIEDALMAFRLVVDQIPEACLEIYGEGSKRSEWESLSEHLGLKGNVFFMGYDPHPAKQYERASAFIMTSLFEAQPLTLLEAIAHGCPVVSYNIKYGPAQMIDHGLNGLLIAEGDIEELAQQTISILTNEQLVAHMSHKSKQKSKEFELPTFFAKWKSLLESVVYQKNSRTSLRRGHLVVTSAVSSSSKQLLGGPPAGTQGTGVDGEPIEITGRLYITSDDPDSVTSNDARVYLRVQHAKSSVVVYLETSHLRANELGDVYVVKAQVDRREVLSKFPGLQSGFELWFEVTRNNAHLLALCENKPELTNGNGLSAAIENMFPHLHAKEMSTGNTTTPMLLVPSIFHINISDPINGVLQRLEHEKCAYIHIKDDNNVLTGRSILQVAHQDPRIKLLVNGLAQRGYYVYHTTNGVSKFVKHEYISTMWQSVINGTYSISKKDVVHILEPPVAKVAARKLIVVFSSIGGDIFGEGLFRYFTQNYKSVQKFVPNDTAILRIADIGGVVGAFYLDTTYRMDNAERIGTLIEEKRLQLGLAKDDVITYGASKGATGALFHALTNGYRSISVEPIVNDHYYEKSFGDTHFTAAGNFPRSKEAVFGELIEHHRTKIMSGFGVMAPRIAVIYSEQSPQFPYIDALLGQHYTPDICLVNFTHPNIHDHPDVSPASLNLLATFMNMACYGLPMPSGNFSIRCE